LVVDGPLPSHSLDNAELGKLKLEHKIREGDRELVEGIELHPRKLC
jgi:hypothetical protein